MLAELFDVGDSWMPNPPGIAYFERSLSFSSSHISTGHASCLARYTRCKGDDQVARGSMLAAGYNIPIPNEGSGLSRLMFVNLL